MTPEEIREARAIALRLYLHALNADIFYSDAMAVIGLPFPHGRFEFNHILGRIVELDRAAGITRRSQSACRLVIRKKDGVHGPGYLPKTGAEGMVG